MTMTPESVRVASQLADRLPRAEAQIEQALILIEMGQEAGEDMSESRAALDATISKVAQWKAMLQARGIIREA